MQKLIFALVALVCAHAGIFATPAKAQGGWDTVKLPQYGLTLRMARNYHPIPVDPRYEYLKLIYEGDASQDEDSPKKFLPRFDLVILDHSLGAAKPESGEEAKSDKDSPPPINSLERYIEQRRAGWNLGLLEEQKDRDGYRFVEYEFLPDKGSARGTVFSFSDTTRTVAFFGICRGEDLDSEQKIWRGMIKKLRLSDPDMAKLDKKTAKQLEAYRKKGFLDPEFRVEARSRLPKGWKFEDTKNYILVYDTKDQALLRLIERELEAIRKEYERLFPPLQPVTAVSRVRICKDQQEYTSYGGPRGSGGYWNSAAEELVFYDYANIDGQAGTGKANSRIVLYHEAFHQFIFYSSGSFSPHSWFNEGTGDYFSGAKISGGKVKRIGVNPWRIQTAQNMIRSKRSAPWKEMIRWSQAEYYGVNKRGLSGTVNYAQGWSMVYFLRESRVAKKHEVWSKILDTYFNTLRETYNKGKAGFEAEGVEVVGAVAAQVGKEARKTAVDVAFADVDFDELEAAWKKFTLGLKVPK